MDNQLRPLNLGEILDRTAELYRHNFWLFAGLVAITMGGVLVLFAGAGGIFGFFAAAGAHVSTHPQWQWVVLGISMVVVGLPLTLVATVFTQAGLTQAAVRVHHGEKLTIREALGSVRPRFWRYLGLFVLQGLLIAGIPLVIFGLVAGPLIFFMTRGAGTIAAGLAMGTFVVLAGVALFAVIVWRALGYSFSLAVCIAEDKPAWESLGRGWELSKGTRGRIFVMFLLVYALALAGSMICYIPIAIATGIIAAMGHGAQYATATLIVSEVLNVLVNITMQIVVTPVSLIGLVLFYFDRRVRTEGYDIEWMMRQAGLAAPPSTAPSGADREIFPPLTPPDTVEER